MEDPVVEARKRLSALEERIPWNAVKKPWATRRQEWVTHMQSTLSVSRLANHLLILESMLKSDALAPTWAVSKPNWKARTQACASAADLDAAVGVLEANIVWQRILIAPDGRPLTAEEIASGQYGVGGAPSVLLPPPLSVHSADNPPEGIPRAASQVLMLLHAMGADRYDPKVIVQLLDVMHGWTAAVLLDASANARLRVLGSARDASTRQQTIQMALQPEPPVETVDVELAVRGRAEHFFTGVAAREVTAQQAADTNAEPMPLLPRKSTVALPADLSECLPSARRLLERGLDVDDDDVDDEGSLWWSSSAGGHGGVGASLLDTTAAASGAAGSAALRVPTHGTASRRPGAGGAEATVGGVGVKREPTALEPQAGVKRNRAS